LGVFAVNDFVFRVDVNFKNQTLTLEEIELVEGYAPDYFLEPILPYKAEVISFKEEKLYSFEFPIELHVYDRPEADVPDLTERIVSLIFPYFDDAKELMIYSPEDRLLLKVDLSEYSQCDKENICDFEEPIFEEKIIKKEVIEEKTSYIWLLITIIATLIIIFTLLIIKKRR